MKNVNKVGENKHKNTVAGGSDGLRGGVGMLQWFKSQRGLSEAAGAIFVLPWIAFMIFALIEAGVNMNTRARVNSITQDVAMNIASDGAVWWVRTSPAGFNDARNWQTIGKDRLKSVCGKDGILCTNVNSVTIECRVEGGMDAGGVGTQIALAKGSKVRCVSTLPYDPISPLSKNPVTSVGFSGLFTKVITSEATAETVVGLND